MYNELPLYQFLNHKGRFLYLIKKPLLGGIYKEKVLMNKENYKIFELYSSGLLIGYIFDFNGAGTTYSKNFISYGDLEDNGSKGRLVYINEHFFIIESEDAQKTLIVGDFENGKHIRRR